MRRRCNIRSKRREAALNLLKMILNYLLPMWRLYGRSPVSSSSTAQVPIMQYLRDGKEHIHYTLPTVVHYVQLKNCMHIQSIW